ncbi:shikimate dehydrogenase [Planococcus lenghuensis]|uniref:Shikimate dehydrogenase (NADP(+)) n=1 Tax=Planococcus lenghuensis TaxID=2213202 RepID=A0A1Q2KXR8_9BACL|nr:shikimate dehydrogenase [Planococcus lenghuensis]AQQ52943.1 shikimate dehydrogenase [Planococcus lenghuensis]
MKKWYAVIGDPISHSLSPYMHDIWFHECGIDASMIPVHIRVGELKEGVAALKRLGVSGFNVTLPFKQEIVPLLGGLDAAAAEMNAVNTVSCNDGRLTGMNTDGDGFVRGLAGENVPKDAPILMVGAGGAARGIAFALKRQGFSRLYIANRTYRRAEELAAASGAIPLSIAEAEEQLGAMAAVINTTSAGLQDDTVPLKLTGLAPGTLVSDIIYNPLETPLLKQAADQGGRVQNGVVMFVHQGAIAFEAWTGIRPDTEPMIEKINRKLGGSYAHR